jgi:hypothetical protein
LVPYDLVKIHEKQVMINHSNQSVDKIAERGGLDWVELYCVLTDTLYDHRISHDLARTRTFDIIDDFIKRTKNNKPNLRPCEVRIDKLTVDAYFHTWCNKSQPTYIPGWPDQIVNYTVGIIEYEDGTIDECHPKNIKFTDRG